MNNTLRRKIEQLTDRYQELGELLSDNDIISNQKLFRSYAKEYSEIEPVVLTYRERRKKALELTEARQMVGDVDPEISVMATEETKKLEVSIATLDQQIRVLLLPQDPNDNSNIFLEIRAGTGGDEAAIFAGDLLRMYTRFAEMKTWQVELLNERMGEHGGYKEVIARISGKDVYANLKFESGAHRVQRVPQTESQGRIHTSACTVAVLPETEDIHEIEVNKSELRIDTFRASGAGGQHVNKTDSAVRLTHIPTGIVVECQDERSQHKNKARAMSLLQAKLLEKAKDEQAADQAQTRRSLVGTGDRSEKIRTYNFPDGRVTDHRINLTLHRLTHTIAGDLEPIINELMQEHQADQLKKLGLDD